MGNTAWEAQSRSLIEVQKQGGDLEKLVGKILNWPSGKVCYEPKFGYKIQVDCAYPSIQLPAAIASVTYTSPDKPGHSNENKLHLKVGELALLKRAYKNLRMILVIGGVKSSWLPYVLNAFEHFYDEVIYLWQIEGVKRLKAIAKKPESLQIKNANLWDSLRNEWNSLQLADLSTVPPCGLIRYAILDKLKNQKPIVHNPSLISNEIARLCMQRSYSANGAEWTSYLHDHWHNIEMSRNYFNPVEAAVEISLQHAHFYFEGGVSRDVEVRSLLHDLGMTATRVSEDFVLFSELLKCPVYIQCKASGGGREQHGKNIQNRAKEQITRSIIYRCRSTNGKIEWGPKKYHWISILDGDWGVTTREPLKYVHMLQLAGYDKLLCASDLLTDELNVKRENNPLITYLNQLKCRTL